MTDQLGAVGQLIAFGLDPRLSPGRSSDYQELVARFRTDPDFRQCVAAVVAGQGLDILDCSPVYGLVLAAKGPDSPYYMRLEDYASMSAEERYLNAFVFLAIATACFSPRGSPTVRSGLRHGILQGTLRASPHRCLARAHPLGSR